MDSTIEQQGGATLIHIIGSIDAHTGPDATQLLEGQIRSGNHQLILNLAGVDFMSSAGVRCILNTLKLARQAGGDLRLAAIAPTVTKVLDMGGVTSILKTYADNDAALESFNS
jgi:anti-anti-sigma factor